LPQPADGVPAGGDRSTGAAPGRLRAALAAARRWPRASAFGLGAVVALALPPLNLWPCLLGFAGLLDLLRRGAGARRAFLLGWCFGFGHCLVGLYWIAIAFFADAERFGLLALPAVLLLCAGLALYPALAALLATLYRWRSGTAAALALALAWLLTEWLRGHLPLGGFPWNLIGYAFAGSAGLSQLAAVTGIWGLSLLAVTIGALPVVLLEPGSRTRWRPPAAAGVILALVWLGGSLRLTDAAGEPATGVHLRLVQANIAQNVKWQPELRARWFQRYLELSARPAERIAAVIWPEAASPYPLDREPEARRLIARVLPPGGLLLTGGERFDLKTQPPRAWNSLFALDDRGRILAFYDKRDLVPFGEFLPFRSALGRLGLEKLTEGSIDFQPGPGRQTLTLPGLPPFSPLICYEAIFPGGVVDPQARPAWLLNVTNDAWFGRSSGPYQHLAMARFRAIEEGLPLVRAANTGISAVVDPYGRIEARLDLGVTGVLDAGLPSPLREPPPFARFGLWCVVLAAMLAGLAMLIIERRAHPAVQGVTKATKRATMAPENTGR
jgi:apolipoprotein N-acyltransferase